MLTSLLCISMRIYCQLTLLMYIWLMHACSPFPNAFLEEDDVSALCCEVVMVLDQLGSWRCGPSKHHPVFCVCLSGTGDCPRITRVQVQMLSAWLHRVVMVFMITRVQVQMFSAWLHRVVMVLMITRVLVQIPSCFHVAKWHLCMTLAASWGLGDRFKPHPVFRMAAQSGNGTCPVIIPTYAGWNPVLFSCSQVAPVHDLVGTWWSGGRFKSYPVFAIVAQSGIINGTCTMAMCRY